MLTSEMNELVINILKEGAELRLQLINHCLNNVIQASTSISQAIHQGGKVLLFGNGGSASDAQHIAAEFVCRFVRDRKALPAIALNADTSSLTAISNDYGFKQVFSRQIQALGQSKDIVVAISTSGRSPNVLTAVQSARELGLTTIGLTGESGEKLAELVDIAIVVPSINVARIQECHITIGHIIVELVENLLFKPDIIFQKTSKAPIVQELVDSSKKILGLEELILQREHWRKEGKVVVWTNGCFDLLHIGHIHSLQSAKALGDILVVGVNGDDSVRQLKGKERPIISQNNRVEMLAALECVSSVIIFDESTPELLLSRLKPDIYCKGSDYAPPNGKPVPEAQLIEAYGGRIEFLPMVPSWSTTDLIKKIALLTKD